MEGCPMNDQERAAAFDRLCDALRERELDWIVDQVLDQLQEGKQIELSEPVLVSLPGRKRAQRVDDGALTVEYTPLERLEVLLEAIRRAIVLPTLFQSD